jgi:RsmE family RNA methyltransferase
MQLFLTPYLQNNADITITEPRVIEQLMRVLRAKVGDYIMVQIPLCAQECKEGTEIVRHTCEITLLTKNTIETKVIDTQSHVFHMQSSALAVAMTNKFEKLELVAQKATEIGLYTMIIFPATRSQIREVSDNKKERLSKIIIEAVEQSYGWVIPSLHYKKDIASVIHDEKIFLLHQD